nr:ABC transporter ATP-binding protein [Lachnospiraceae bacterium]
MENEEKKDETVKLPYFGLNRLLPYLKPHRKMIFSMIALIIVGGAVDIVLPLFQQYAINHFITGKTLDTLTFFILIYVGVLVVQILANTTSAFLCGKLEMTLDHDLREVSFNHLQTLSFSYFNQNSVGYIQARVMSDTGRIGGLLSWGMMDGIWNSIYIIGAMAVMVVTNWRLALVVLIIVPIVGIVAGFFQGKLVKLHRNIREINSRIAGNFNEGITGAKTTKTLVIEKKMEDTFEETTGEMKAKSVSAAHYRSLFSTLIEFSASLALALVLWRGGLISMNGLLTIGTLSVFMSYALNMMEPIRWVVRCITDLINIQVNIERFTRL